MISGRCSISILEWPIIQLSFKVSHHQPQYSIKNSQFVTNKKLKVDVTTFYIVESVDFFILWR